MPASSSVLPPSAEGSSPRSRAAFCCGVSVQALVSPRGLTPNRLKARWLTCAARPQRGAARRTGTQASRAGRPSLLKQGCGVAITQGAPALAPARARLRIQTAPWHRVGRHAGFARCRRRACQPGAWAAAAASLRVRAHLVHHGPAKHGGALGRELRHPRLARGAAGAHRGGNGGRRAARACGTQEAPAHRTVCCAVC